MHITLNKKSLKIRKNSRNQLQQLKILIWGFLDTLFSTMLVSSKSECDSTRTSLVRGITQWFEKKFQNFFPSNRIFYMKSRTMWNFVKNFSIGISQWKTRKTIFSNFTYPQSGRLWSNFRHKFNTGSFTNFFWV